MSLHSADQIKSCKTIKRKTDSELQICKNTEPIFFNYNDNCILKLFYNPFKSETNCRHHRIEPQNRLTKLEKGNTWLFYTKSEIKLTITCTQHDETIILTGTGVINFDENCNIKSENFQLPTYKNSLTSSIWKNAKNIEIDLSQINMTTGSKELEPITKIIISRPDTHKEDFKLERTKIIELQEETNQLAKNLYYNRQEKNTYKIVAVTIATCAMIIILVLAVKIIYMKWKKWINRTPREEKASQGKSIPTLKPQSIKDTQIDIDINKTTTPTTSQIDKCTFNIQ